MNASQALGGGADTMRQFLYAGLIDTLHVHLSWRGVLFWLSNVSMTASMPPVGRLAAVSLDASDPLEEATFWQGLLGLEIIWQNDDFIALRGSAVLLTVQRVPDHRRPTWPGGDTLKQMHLEVSVADLDEAEQLAVSLGALRAAEQPRPGQWRVLIDPAGHPFCISNQIPEP